MKLSHMGILVSYPVAVRKMPERSTLMDMSQRLIWLSVPEYDLIMACKSWWQQLEATCQSDPQSWDREGSPGPQPLSVVFPFQMGLPSSVNPTKTICQRCAHDFSYVRRAPIRWMFTVNHHNESQAMLFRVGPDFYLYMIEC